MNLKKRLRHLAGLQSQDQKNNLDDTKLVSIVHAARDNGGLFITTSVHEAKTLERMFGFPCRSIDINLEGYAGPFYFDPSAIQDMFLKAANKIDALEKENESLKGVVELEGLENENV